MPVDHPLWIAHQRTRLMRPDAERYWRPEAGHIMTPEAARQLLRKKILAAGPEYQDATELTAEIKRQRGYDAELAEIKYEHAALGLAFALLQLQRLRGKAGYSPTQLRDDVGRWADGGGGASRQTHIRLAGDLPTDDTPEIPKERPSDSRERYGMAKAAARFLVRVAGPLGTLGMIVEGGHWLYEYDADIKASLEGPKSLQELHGDVSRPGRGYHVHHIVEQDSARQDGYPNEMVEGRDNRVRIPAMRHRDITAWYQTRNEDFGYRSPREYLRGKSWEERKKIGLGALIDFGVLKP
jgi:hypothetical protein